MRKSTANHRTSALVNPASVCGEVRALHYRLQTHRVAVSTRGLLGDSSLYGRNGNRRDWFHGGCRTLFSRELHLVRQDGIGVRFVNVRPAWFRRTSIDVDAVDGFSSLSVGRSRLAHAEHQLAFRRAPGPSTGTDGGFGPIAIADGYDYPVQHGFDGTGIAVGFIVPGSELDSDVSTYLAEFGITRTGPATMTVKVDGGCTTGCDAVIHSQRRTDRRSGACGRALRLRHCRR